MKNRVYVAIELFVLFVLLPLSLLLGYSFWIKSVIIIFSFIYILFVLLRIEKSSIRPKNKLDWKPFWKRMLILFPIVVLVTTSFVLVADPDNLFCVVIHKPKLWLMILLIYTLLSVWPQELVYRTFFFKRYEIFFQNRKIFLFINAIIFSLGHLFFRNTLVIVLTFIGGLFFAFTFDRSRSTLLVSIEHALYGSWLFTVGMGEMLAFPGMESC